VSEFSSCFLLVFAQLAAGGIAGLAVPPFHVIQRGFYKSSAGIFVGCALVFLAGKVALAFRAGGASGATVAEIALWALFSAAAAVYLASLWGDDAPRRARAFVASLALGLVALTASATVHRLGPVLSPATVLYPLAFVTAALTLGAVANGMLLGHWYLIDLGLSIEPMRRLFRYFMAVVGIHVVVLGVTVGILALSAGPGGTAVRALWQEHATLLVARFVLGPFAAFGLGWMIHRTLQIPQTMAATGLFYIAILFVMVGEILGRLILFRTSLPL
jgi:hypothetical protein